VVTSTPVLPKPIPEPIPAPSGSPIVDASSLPSQGEIKETNSNPIQT
jgi:hypothetical protein